MSISVERGLTALGLGALALVVGGRSLAFAPVYLYHDEAIYALHAVSLLRTAHDLNGLHLPLFVHTFAWVPPIAIYSRTLTFLFAPVSEATTRVPGVVFLAIDVMLTYVAGRLLFRRDSLAVLAALFVLLTPAHLIHARLATDHICALPFFIGYLALTLAYIEQRRLWLLVAATASLGLGIYGYNGAMTVTPVFLAFTAGVLWFVLGTRTIKPFLAAAAGFALALAPFIVWLLIHPEQLRDQFRSYDVSAAGGAVQRSAAASLFSAIVARLDAYYNYFDPSLLFFKGDQSLLDSTRVAGVFLLPILVLLPAGAYYILKHRRTAADVFILMGLLVAPIGALVVAEVKASRALVIVPLAALVSARGVEALVRRRSTLGRAAAVALVIGMAVQFQSFYQDYVGGYRERSGSWFESNRDGAFDRLVALAEPSHARMYVSGDIPMVHFSWQFWALKHRRPDLTSVVSYFGPYGDVSAAPRGSLFLTPYSDHERGIDPKARVTEVGRVENADGHPAFVIYRK